VRREVRQVGDTAGRARRPRLHDHPGVAQLSSHPSPGRTPLADVHPGVSRPLRPG
jgi:hypothetical protein